MYHQIRTIYNQQALWPTLCKSYLESTIKLDFTLDLQLKITLNKKYKKKSNLWEFGTWDNVTQTESECKEKLWSGRVYELTCRPCPIKKKTHSTRKSRSPRPKKKNTISVQPSGVPYHPCESIQRCWSLWQRVEFYLILKGRETPDRLLYYKTLAFTKPTHNPSRDLATFPPS